MQTFSTLSSIWSTWGTTPIIWSTSQTCFDRICFTLDISLFLFINRTNLYWSIYGRCDDDVVSHFLHQFQFQNPTCVTVERSEGGIYKTWKKHFTNTKFFPENNVSFACRMSCWLFRLHTKISLRQPATAIELVSSKTQGLESFNFTRTFLTLLGRLKLILASSLGF